MRTEWLAEGLRWMGGRRARCPQIPTHAKVASGMAVAELLGQVLAQPELWNRNPCRLSRHGPHHETEDMFLRFRDETPFRESGNWMRFCDPHLASWNETIDHLPAARTLVFECMAAVQGEVLGGVFLYKVRPGKQIYPHIDSGWHPDFYDKLNVCLSSNPDARFYYDESEPMVQAPGDVHWFRNDVMHGVVNAGTTDHIILTVCLRADTGVRDSWSPAGWSMDESLHAIKEGA